MHSSIEISMRQPLPVRARFKSAAIFYGLAILIMLAAIPWPGMAAGRALFRGL
jgi:hypothetical protein